LDASGDLYKVNSIQESELTPARLQSGSRELWVLDGNFLKPKLSPSSQFSGINLSELSRNQGFRIPRLFNPVFVGDTDGDGFETLRFAVQTDIGYNVMLIDGDDLANLPADAEIDELLENGGRLIDVTPTGVTVLGGRRNLIEIPDIDGDDIPDFAEPLDLDDSTSFVLLSGAVLSTAVETTTNNRIVFDAPSLLVIETPGDRFPLLLADENASTILFINSIADSPKGIDDAGMIGSIYVADIKRAIAEGFEKITVVLPSE